MKTLKIGGITITAENIKTGKIYRGDENVVNGRVIRKRKSRKKKS